MGSSLKNFLFYWYIKDLYYRIELFRSSKLISVKMSVQKICLNSSISYRKSVHKLVTKSMFSYILLIKLCYTRGIEEMT